jgi:hypothetical protein
MTIKVIGAGLGRTGTASLKLALEQLGFGPCYHMGEVLALIEQRVPLWVEAGKGEADWEAIFDGYQSAMDYPSCSFWREQMAYYPNAKVILSTRSAESWFDSVHGTIMSPDATAWMESGPTGEFFETCMWKEYKPHIFDRDWMINYFNEREAQIKAEVPADRLLVFNVKEGWEPLCRFLAVDIPESDFPRVNSREETRKLLDVMISIQDDGDISSTMALERERLFKDTSE